VTAKRILLVGMMGVGKSTVGRALSEQTGWPYVDNDELLHADTGMYGAELLARVGVQALRDAEAAVLAEILQREPPVVAGIAAGVVLRPDDRQRIIDGGFVVWLRARTETLVQRIGGDQDRAWLQPDPAAALRELAAGRDPLYAEVADLIVDVDDHDVTDTVQEIRHATG
jgi:shikimate kinase